MAWTQRRVGPGLRLARSPICLVLVGALALFNVVANTGFSSPPRYDGAGYSVLAESLRTGRGYRSIDHPDAPLHAHFPPGYPVVLAGLWSVVGRSVVAAHVLSGCCTSCAVLLLAGWFRRALGGRAWLPLSIALAVNWTWGRVGGSIQSEPLFLLLVALTVHTYGTGEHPVGRARAVLLGVLLSATILTRHVGVCVTLALLLDLWLRRDRRSVVLVASVSVLGVLPWGWWLLTARTGSQLDLFESNAIWHRVLLQCVFYLRRIPDQIIGPLIESATVFGRSHVLSAVATVAGIVLASLILVGWTRTLRSNRRRVAGLVGGISLTLLLVWPFTEAGRFLIPLVPFLLLGGVMGITSIALRQRFRISRRLAALVMLAVSIPYSSYSIVRGRAEAERRTHEGFDRACAWLAESGSRDGPVLTRHPGEVFWQTGHLALSADGTPGEPIGSLINRYGVAYLLVDDDRYAKAPTSPLGIFASAHAARVKLVVDGPVRVFEVIEP